MKRIQIFENGIHTVFEITDENQIKLLHFSALPFDEKTVTSRSGSWSFRPFELQLCGIDREGERHGNKYVITAPAFRMKYRDFRDTNNQLGRKIEVEAFDEETGITVIFHMQFYTGVSTVRCCTEVINNGKEDQIIEYVSSFALNGIEKEGLTSQDEKMRIGICHNSWVRELQWQFVSLEEVGLGLVQKTGQQRSSKVLGVTNIGNWSAKEYIPMGYIENTETRCALMWQIEHNGSWHWEISDHEGHLYLQLSGPSEIESHWCKKLKAGKRFISVPCSICAVNGGFDEAAAQMTLYRRLIRRRNNDNKNLPVIFNDYMNCLWGDPTADKEYTMIDTAAELGCEYYVIDAGWYADGNWWEWVGEWEESKKRFPEGIKKVTDYIRKKGMIPGLWLEVEVIGKYCPLAEKIPDSWFFQRHGKRIFDRGRYQLDFRNPEVRAHCDAIVDRLVKDYGVGYIKMDYNIEPGIGTDYNADSFGEGLLGHQRAYLAWLENQFERHKSLVIENCSSGGLRMDYAMLSRCSIQSTSDQDDYKLYATIAANAPSAVCPEQAAVWSYPMKKGDGEETVFNMVSAMLLRIHQSGNINGIGDDCKELIKEGIAVYKRIRKDIKDAVPFWSLGLSKYSDDWVSMGLKCENKSYVAVWRRGGEDTCVLPIPHYKGCDVRVKCIYPEFNEYKFTYSNETSALSVKFDEINTARLFEIDVVEETSI